MIELRIDYRDGDGDEHTHAVPLVGLAADTVLTRFALYVHGHLLASMAMEDEDSGVGGVLAGEDYGDDPPVVVVQVSEDGHVSSWQL